MAKALKTVATVAAVAAVAFAFAPGAGFGAAILTGMAPIAAGIAAVANVGAQLLAPAIPQGGREYKVLINNAAATPYAMGRTSLGGVLVHDAAYGPSLKKIPNPNRSMVMVYSDCGPVESIEGLYADGAFQTAQGNAVGYYGAGAMNFASQLGSRPEVSALSGSQGVIPGWGSSYKLSGKAAGLVTMRMDKLGKIYSSGAPELSVVGKWVKVYSARHDSTYPGGSGPCRIGDESTYIWSENPSDHAVTYAYGRYENGNRVFGVGLPIESIDMAAMVEWANLCDTNGWKLGGVIYEPNNKWNNLKLIMEAGGARPVHNNAILSVVFDAPKTALDTFTEDDLAPGDVAIPSTQSFRDRINGIVPRYRSEAHNWEYVAGSLVSISQYVTEDGEPRDKERQYSLCQQSTQAAQLAAYEVVNARELRGIQLPFKPRVLDYGPGEAITLNMPNLGLSGTFVIESRDFNPVTSIVNVTLRSKSAGSDAFALGATTTPPATTTLVFGDVLDGSSFNSAGGFSQEQVLINQSWPKDIVITGSDNAGVGEITISAHDMVYATDTVAVDGATLTGLLLNTKYYIYYDDSDRVGGAVSYVATTDITIAQISETAPFRHFVGSVATPLLNGSDITGDVKTNTIVSVTDNIIFGSSFDIKADGVTVDDVAFQAFLDAFNGSRLYGLLPAGNIILTKKFALPEGAIIHGAGRGNTTITWRAGTGEGFTWTPTTGFSSLDIGFMSLYTESKGTGLLFDVTVVPGIGANGSRFVPHDLTCMQDEGNLGYWSKIFDLSDVSYTTIRNVKNWGSASFPTDGPNGGYFGSFCEIHGQCLELRFESVDVNFCEKVIFGTSQSEGIHVINCEFAFVGTGVDLIADPVTGGVEPLFSCIGSHINAFEDDIKLNGYHQSSIIGNHLSGTDHPTAPAGFNLVPLVNITLINCKGTTIALNQIMQEAIATAKTAVTQGISVVNTDGSVITGNSFYGAINGTFKTLSQGIVLDATTTNTNIGADNQFLGIIGEDLNDSGSNNAKSDFFNDVTTGKGGGSFIAKARPGASLGGQILLENAADSANPGTFWTATALADNLLFLDRLGNQRLSFLDDGRLILKDGAQDRITVNLAGSTDHADSAGTTRLSLSTTGADITGTLTVSGVITQGGTAVSLAGHTHAAGDITSGILAVARIPNLSATKITSGVFTTARIPTLDAAKITTGVFPLARIPAGTADIDNATVPATITLRGNGSGFDNANLVLVSGTSTNIRSLGVFAYDEGGGVEWFFGRGYNGSDNFKVLRQSGLLAHNASTSDAATATELLLLDNAGNMNLTGDLILKAHSGEGGQVTLKGNASDSDIVVDAAANQFRQFFVTGIEFIMVANKGGDTSLYGNGVKGLDVQPTGIRITGATRHTVKILTDGPTITPNMNEGDIFTVTLAGNRTLANPINVTAGQKGSFVIKQDATGNRTLGFGANFKWAGGSAPTLSTVANTFDVIGYQVISSTEIICTFN